MSSLVRPATVDDVGAVVRLRQAMFAAMASAGAAARPDLAGDTSWHPAARRDLAVGIDAGTLRACVLDDPDPAAATGGSGLIACAVATLEQRLPAPGFPTGLSGSMSSVFVAPAHRGRGLARIVVRAALDWLDQQGVEIIDLHATPAAEPLYRSLGFTDSRLAALRRVGAPGPPREHGAPEPTAERA